MNSTSTNPVENEKQTKPIHAKPALLWRILRWFPLIILLLSIGALLTMFLLGGMPKISAWYIAQSELPLIGIITIVVCGIYALIKRRTSRLWKATMVLGLIALVPLLMLVKPMAFPVSLKTTTPALTVRLPANIPLKVAWGGDTPDTNYHVIVADQRWAYDLVVAPYFSGSDQLEDYGCYSVPVVSPISGLVSEAHDGEPDEIPGVVSNNLTAPKGNFVVIQTEHGTYLEIAHMKSGSVAVKTGETVREGQTIGQCGNSGNTSEPHIHIHHQRQDPAGLPVGFAEGLPLYFRDHDGAPMPLGGFEVIDGTATPKGDVVLHIGK